MARSISIVTGLAILATVCAGSPPAAAPQAERLIDGGAFEASGVAGVDSGNGVLFVDDNDNRHVLWMDVASDGTQRAAPLRIPLGVSVMDPEGLTTDGRYFYVVGSQSKPNSPPGAGLVRFQFDAQSRKVAAVEALPGLKQLLVATVPELKGHDTSRGDDRFNIEGLAWDPSSSRLLLGLRAPVSDQDAIVVPIGFRDAAAPLARNNIRVDPIIRIPLGGAGIRSLEYDAERQRFLVISGAAPNTENLDFRILEWNPAGGGDALREIKRFGRDLKPEGITRATIGGANMLFLVFDTNRYLAMK